MAPRLQPATRLLGACCVRTGSDRAVLRRRSLALHIPDPPGAASVTTPAYRTSEPHSSRTPRSPGTRTGGRAALGSLRRRAASLLAKPCRAARTDIAQPGPLPRLFAPQVRAAGRRRQARRRQMNRPPTTPTSSRPPYTTTTSRPARASEGSAVPVWPARHGAPRPRHTDRTRGTRPKRFRTHNTLCPAATARMSGTSPPSCAGAEPCVPLGASSALHLLPAGAHMRPSDNQPPPPMRWPSCIFCALENTAGSAITCTHRAHAQNLPAPPTAPSSPPSRLAPAIRLHLND